MTGPEAFAKVGSELAYFGALAATVVGVVWALSCAQVRRMDDGGDE